MAPVLGGAALAAAGVLQGLLPMEIGGSSCGGSGLAVARRTAFVDAHDRECTRQARQEVAFSTVLVVGGIATAAVTARLART